MSKKEPVPFPEQSSKPAEVKERLAKLRADDLDWRGGRAFSLVYNSDDHEHEELLEQVATQYQHDNALNPFAYPSLLQMELELVGMAAGLFGTDAGRGFHLLGRHREHLPGDPDLARATTGRSAASRNPRS